MQGGLIEPFLAWTCTPSHCSALASPQSSDFGPQHGALEGLGKLYKTRPRLVVIVSYYLS